MGGKRRERIKIGLALLLACAPYAPRSADAQSLCKSCEVQVGLGGTYHYWGTTGGVGPPGSGAGGGKRHEARIVRGAAPQKPRRTRSGGKRPREGPHWGVSLPHPGAAV